MSKSNAFETDSLELWFQAVTVANLADDASASPATDIYWSLHTGDPGEAGNQSTSEAAYTSYARKTVARTSGGHAVAAGVMNPVANIDFVTATGGSETEQYFGTGTNVSNYLMYSGTVTPNIVVSSGVTPRLTTASNISED